MTNAYTATSSSISTTVSGQGYTVTIYPGQIDPTKCYTSLSGSLSGQASIAYDFTIYFVDLWDNLHWQSLSDELAAGMVVSVYADYQNHDNYPSPLGVPDYPDRALDSLYDTTRWGSASDKGDGTMSATVSIYWAGTHTLTVQVDYKNVISSPLSPLEIEPYTISAANCLTPDSQTQMYAGWDYYFRIQARDDYHNNI